MPGLFELNEKCLVLQEKVTKDNVLQVVADLQVALLQGNEINEIKLAGDFTDSASVKEIFDVIKSYPNIITLDMEGCNIGAGGIANIIDMINCLSEINLENTGLRDNEIVQIANALLQNHTIVSINIASNEFNFPAFAMIIGVVQRNKNILYVENDVSDSIVLDKEMELFLDTLQSNKLEAQKCATQLALKYYGKEFDQQLFIDSLPRLAAIQEILRDKEEYGIDQDEVMEKIAGFQRFLLNSPEINKDFLRNPAHYPNLLQMTSSMAAVELIRKEQRRSATEVVIIQNFKDGKYPSSLCVKLNADQIVDLLKEAFNCEATDWKEEDLVKVTSIYNKGLKNHGAFETIKHSIAIFSQIADGKPGQENNESESSAAGKKRSEEKMGDADNSNPSKKSKIENKGKEKELPNTTLNPQGSKKRQDSTDKGLVDN